MRWPLDVRRGRDQHGAVWTGRAAASVPEVAVAREHHGEPGLVGRPDHLVVPHRAAGLDHGRRARLGGGQQAVREGEEGVGGDDRALGEALGQARGLRGLRRPSRPRCGRNRPGSSGPRRCRPSRRPWHRRWRSTSRAWRPGRRSGGRRARPRSGARLRHDLAGPSRRPTRVVAALRQEPARDRADRQARRPRDRAGRPRAAGAGSSSPRRWRSPPRPRPAR